MGSRGQYAASNRFSLYFEPKYRKVDEICGVKVLELKSGSGNLNLPEYAKKSTAYIGIDKAGKFMRIRIYKDHRPVIDIDFGHPNHHGLKMGISMSIAMGLTGTAIPSGHASHAVCYHRSMESMIQSLPK